MPLKYPRAEAGESPLPGKTKRGPYKKRPPEERFWAKVEAADCWEFTGTLTRLGYGVFGPSSGESIPAHRYAYTLLVGPIPEGMVLDHLCRNPRCVNPDHLRVVTQRDNVLAGYGPSAMCARKTTCKRGHDLTGANLYRHPSGSRQCRICNCIRQADLRARKATKPCH